MGNGSEWLKQTLKLETISPLGETIADLLDDVWAGIYHLPTTYLERTNWADPDWIIVIIPNGLATFDNNGLTMLVVLVHDRMLRMEIRGRSHSSMELLFHLRKARTGRTFERCPTLEIHSATIRNSVAHRRHG